jgi:hypothetical protein
MSHSSWPTLAALSLLPLAVAAQPKVQAADPADARAPAPALGYQSSFKTDLPLAKHDEPADKTWIAANREVQGQGDLPESPMGTGAARREPAAPAAATTPAHQKHSEGH